MKVGMGVRGEARIDKNHLQYLAQIGAPHAVVFMPDKQLFPDSGAGPWSVDELVSLKKFYKENGVKIEGFENFHPDLHYKVLLDLPGKEKQLDDVKRCIENMGKAGIRVMGYNLSIAGVTGLEPATARGGAKTVRFNSKTAPINGHVPLGTVFNRVVMPDAPEGPLPFVSLEEMLQRRDWFLSQVIPVAEEAGVIMAAHPDDPPVPVMKNTSRILINKERYDELFAKYDSPSNCIEFCQGTFGETGVDVYDTIRYFASKNKIGYVHFRNIKGTVHDEYTEVFIDEGDMDMVKSLQAYKECGYTGLLMPDHTPVVSIEPSNEIGMAFAIGYIRGIMKTLDIEIED